MNRPARRPSTGGRVRPRTGSDGGSGGLARIGVMGVIVIAILLGGWLAVARACASSCDDRYCVTTLDVGPPQGFVFASDVFEYRGDAPDLPTDGSAIEIVIPLNGAYEEGSSVNFYRYLPESSAWDLVTQARIDDDGERAVGVFSELPPMIVLMQRSSPAGHSVAFLNPGQQLHPEARERVSMVHTRDLTPTGSGGLDGDVSLLELQPDQQHFTVISAGNATEGTVANVDAILASSGTRTSHVQQIVDFAMSRDIDGVNIAYADLREDQRTSFGLFIEELALELERVDRSLAVTVAAPTRTSERVEPGPYDWEVIGQAADQVILLPTRDQSGYRSNIPEILRFLTEQMPARKLLLTVSPYAVERSETVRTLTMAEAMQIATRIEVGDSNPTTNENVQLTAVNVDQTDGRSGMLWDASTATVAFTYRDDGGRTVWLENAYSVAFKLEFVTVFGLGGFAVEDASDNEFLGNIWPGVTTFIETGQARLERPDPEALLPRWEVSGGSLEGGQRGVARWTTPSEPGTYTVRLTLSDGVFQFQNETTVTVEARTEPDNGEGD